MKYVATQDVVWLLKNTRMKNLHLTALIVAITTTSFFSCKQNKEARNQAHASRNIGITQAITDNTIHASCPYLTTDNHANPVLCWTEKVDTLHNILAYAVFDQKRQSFGSPIHIKETLGMHAHHESMAKVASKKDGTMLAVFRISTPTAKSRFAGSMYFTQSFDKGKSWTPKQKLVTDSTSYNQSFYDLTLLKDGELGMSWLDARRIEKDKEGSTLFFAKTKGKLGFVNEKPIAGATCQCCRTDIFNDSNGDLHIGYRNIIQDSIRDMFYLTSTNSGATFEKQLRIGEDNWVIRGCPHTGPTIAFNGTKIGIAWFTMGGQKGIYFTSKDKQNNEFMQRTLLSDKIYHPQMIGTDDGNFVLVTEEESENNNLLNRIVLRLISSDQKVIRYPISVKGTNNEYPVIIRKKNGDLLIVWVEISGKHSKLVYQEMNIKTIRENGSTAVSKQTTTRLPSKGVPVDAVLCANNF